MFVKYIGPADSRTVAKAELGYEVAEDDLEVNFVWDKLNDKVVEMNAHAFEQLQLKTARADWVEVDELPDGPAISGEEIEAIDDQSSIIEHGQEALQFPAD